MKPNTPHLEQDGEETICTQWERTVFPNGPFFTEEVPLDKDGDGDLLCGYSFCRFEVPQG